MTQAAIASVGQTVRAPKTAEIIASRIRGQIVRGALKTGETLPPEVTLMAQFGVSRPTLREAFRILETEALISIRRGSRGGAQVMAPDLSVAARYVGLLLQVQDTTISDVYDARMVLEPVCARMMASRRTKAELTEMSRCIGEIEEIVEAGHEAVPDPGAWARGTYRFHELILQGSGNKTMAVQGGVLQEVVATHLDITVARNFDANTQDRFRRTIKSYKKLLELLEARDAEGAEKHWRNHMEVAAKSLLGDDIKNKSIVDLFN